ncbi:MAG: 3'-5' exonuclease [Cellvibrionaceae bacterium]
MSLIATLDIEASGIHPDSYPIEVGIILPNGDSYCSLIKPAPSWAYWDDDAQKIHGISQDELLSNGKSPTEVAGNLNDILQQTTVFSDCWVLDQPWLIKLFQQAALSQTFTLLDMMHIMSEEDYECLPETKQEIALGLNIERHRATNDARILQLAYDAISNDANSE